MINPIIFDFLTRLKENNNREWFTEHKPEFIQAKEAFEKNVTDFINIVKEIDPSVGDQVAKDCIFRIYRDTRFAKDKTPYKTNMGAFVSKGGRKSPLAGYYLHLEPNASMIAGGIYCPQSDVLKAVRKEIYHFPDEFKQILFDSEFKDVFPLMYEDKLKMAPKGFPKDFEDIELLKYKSYTVLHSPTDAELTGKNAESHIKRVVKVLEPFNSFINRGITEEEEEIQL